MYQSIVSADIGQDNVAAAKLCLEQASVSLVGECVGGAHGRTVDFCLNTGLVTVKQIF